MAYQGSLNATVFLARLIEGATRKIRLIADRLQANETAEVTTWIAPH